jgi:putative nucleotidyltransferase with HDIG domain
MTKMKYMDLTERIMLIGNPELRKAILKYVEINARTICDSPASINYHHNWKGGLLQHTIEVHDIAITIAQNVRNRDRPVDMDSIRASAILHDLGKMFLYEESKENEGKFYYKLRSPPDHAVMIVADFQDVTRYALPKNIHLNILSHEGGWSRTGVSPDTLEASIIASADLVSSRLDCTSWAI